MQRRAPAAILISLRTKLLVGFTLVFTLILVVAFYWIFGFTTERALERVTRDMLATVKGTAEGLDPLLLTELYRDGEVNAAGFSDHPAYAAQIAWFKTVNSLEPRAWPFTYIKGSGSNEIIYLADLWAVSPHPDRAAGFKEVDVSTGPLLIGLEQISTFLPRDRRRLADERSETFLPALFIRLGILERVGYADQFGEWVTAYYPLRSADGTVIGAVGLDFEASTVDENQDDILRRMVNAFSVTYLALFMLVYLVAQFVTRPLRNFAEIAQGVAEGHYEPSLARLKNVKSGDEIQVLARVFGLMIERVEQREEKLKQEVMQLKIEIDDGKRQEQVSQIVDSDFFKDLKSKAEDLRNRRRTGKLSSET